MLVGNKVVLEEIDPENIEQMRQWRNNPNLRRYFREYRDITKDMQEKWYKERGNNSDPNHIYFQIMKKCQVSGNVTENTKVLIGCAGLHYIKWDRIRSAEFGIFLGKERGTGLGKESLMLLCDYAFKELNLHKVWAEVYVGNNALNLYKKIGFKEDGILRDNQFCEGKYLDAHMISVLEDEWYEQYGDKPLWEIEEF